MKATTLFQAHRFPLVWVLLFSLHFAIMNTATYDGIFFLGFGYIALLPFGTWIQDIEAGRHNALKKNIITILIALSCTAMCIGFANSTDERTRVTVEFSIMLAIQITYLIATIWERKVR